MNASIRTRTLTDGGQAAEDVASEIATFLGGAKHSLDLAHYDFNLQQATAGIVGGAIADAAARGVAVRFLWNADHELPIPVPPPPEPDGLLIATLGVPAKPVAGIPDLMHHKYVVRDGAAVLTGSTNWTDDSWTREENVLVTVDSPELAHAFTLDFEQLWETGDVARSGFVEPRPVEVGGAKTRAWFTPGYGDALSHRVAKLIGRARSRIRICSPVISAAPVLATLAQVVSDGKVDFRACVDATQIREVLSQWHENGNAAWKIPLLERVLAGPVTGKESTPWGPQTVHDFMHAKVTVADDTVFVGSFNLSHSGERNAENVLEIRDAGLADELAAYCEGVIDRYGPLSL
ncbi:MAG TPA: phosphatidylserine/phosphatidylglycerophosphate/cardiolipin synthase family protein [Gaiellaceae bacterium]|nr:phosphatidylserine/phosphatidylglycerophosphate/cardiolipin synthase family protein [Gaiellaceae bacterium]